MAETIQHVLLIRFGMAKGSKPSMQPYHEIRLMKSG
jgi:hypothetical protein